MQALRLIRQADQDGRLSVQLPSCMEVGRLVELIILPIDADRAAEGETCAVPLEYYSGFAAKVLGAPSEEAWNDV